MYIDGDGLINVSEGLIKSAKKDFVRGGKYFYTFYGHIPDMEEYYSNVLKYNKVPVEIVRWMHDAWRFVIDDPYELFSNAGADAVIHDWKIASIMEYHKKAYMESAKKIFEKKPEIRIRARDMKSHSGRIPLTDEEILKLIGNKYGDMYIKARDYILSFNKAHVLDEWNKTISDRVRKDSKKLQVV